MSTETAAERKWKPLTSIQRRVLGVLVEKGKTTPDQYPLSLNSLVTGCNQKTNRDPQMNLNEDQVETAISELREIGVVVEVQGSGRVPRYRHLAYEWLGVEKAELGVMAELLLRGAQTIGELRGHASRMENIPDLNALKPILQSLIQKGLVLEFTPEGRGQVIGHALYREKEMAELKTRFASGAPPVREATEGASSSVTESRSAAPSQQAAQQAAQPAVATSRGVTSDMFSELQLEVAELRAEVARLRTAVQELRELIG